MIHLVVQREKDEARKFYEENRLLIWYRRKYNLPPNDQRYLSITRKEIEREWHLDQIYADEQAQLAKDASPYCPECDYVGFPIAYPQNKTCPKCGAEVMPSKADQAANEEAENDALRRLNLTKEDIVFKDEETENSE